MPLYATIRVPASHPLAIKNASYLASADTVQIRLHRYLLFEKIGYGPHWCHWCRKNINWQPGKRGGGGRCLVVDHLDGDRINNDPANLVSSCTGCNVHRAHPFALVSDDEPYIMNGTKRIRAVGRTCVICGKNFLIRAWAARQPKLGRYCSRQCMYDRNRHRRSS